MIYSLQKKVIRICGIVVTIVFFVIFLLVCYTNIRQLNMTMDILTDQIASNDGTFPEVENGTLSQEPEADTSDFMTEETPFSTRFFTVRFDEDGKITEVNTESVLSVTSDTARQYGQESYKKGRERGWLDNYRYKMFDTEQGKAIVYVDGTMNRYVTQRMILSSGIVLTISAAIIWIIIAFYSKRVVKPVAESYEKQKQFVTDASHELKTPLTLILTNLDILEAEVGKNEWLADIRSEGERMSSLVNQLVMLARMDEDQTHLVMKGFSLSDMITETVEEFQMLAEAKGKHFVTEIASGVHYTGDQEAIRKVITILLDNAINIVIWVV